VRSPVDVFDSAADSYGDPHHGELADRLVAGLPRTRSAPPALVVDVATGTGVAAFAALRLLDARSVLAVDLSPRMVDRARARAVTADPDGRVTWRVAPAVPLDVPDGSVDVVLCTSALHFLGTAALRDWLRVLRPGGQVAFTVPLAADFRPSEAFRELLAADLTIPADAAAARRLALDAGFVRVGVELTEPEPGDRPRRTFLVRGSGPAGELTRR
jgi:ubiquinone/menaquinone biosynthesis C-methylase UbiE